MSYFFVKLYRYFQKHPLFLWGLLLLLSVFFAYSASKIRFVEDISSFLPNNESNKRINDAYQYLGASNKIVVSVKQANKDLPPAETDKELLTNAASLFVDFLSKKDTSGHIKEIRYEIDQQQIALLTDFLVRNMPYFLSAKDYAHIDSLLTPQNIEEQLKKNKQLLLSPMGAFVRAVLVADPLHFSNSILQGLSAFQLDDRYRIEDDFIFNQQGTETIITITSAYPVSETAHNKLVAQEIEQAIQYVEQHFDHQVKLSAFGAALISVTNAEQIKKDSLLAICLSLFFILALLIYFFRNARSLFLIAVSLLFGALFALGIIVLFKDTISIIAIGIASVIMGIAINYPLHFLAHYQHKRNKEETIKEIISPLLIGNITTVGAFLSLLFISSDAMKDLGLFASFLLMGTILFVLLFLPHLLSNAVLPNLNREYHPAFAKLAAFEPEKKKWIVHSVFILTVVFLMFSLDTSFETNMHTINYMTKEQRMHFEQILKENDTNNQMLYCIAEGKTTDEALSSYENVALLLDSLHTDSLLLRKTGIGIYLPSQKMQQQRIEQWNRFWKDKRASLLETLDKTAQQQGYNTDAFDVFKSVLCADYTTKPLPYFALIHENLCANYMSVMPEKTMIFTVLQLHEANKRQVEEHLNKVDDTIFTFDNTSLTDRMINALSNDFNYVLFICGFIVFFFLLFSFGRIELALMAFIPLAVAWIWILGLMGLFGLKFNIINIILATFIFGQGDDYTIFVTEGLLYEYTYRKKMLASFKTSILLSAIIMFLAIGMLIFAQHPAMRSLGEVTIVGMISVVMMAYLFPPLLFNILTKKKGKYRLMPVSLGNIAKTILSFFVFLIGSLTITFVGFFLLTLAGKTQKHKYRFHQLLCATFKLLARAMIQLPFKVINPHNERFDKPCIIIANHQSHIDLLYMLMLSPKIITLTNQWVWKSPFYGRVIRYADFLPVVDGIEQHVDKLEKVIADGYSILIFPEGTRSEDCSIGRFHKGAFYLANKLNLDIVPVLLHGIGHALPKKEFLLRKGQVHIKILERITPINPLRKNTDLLEFSKRTRTLYKSEYNRLSTQIETPAYFADKVLHNYIYKGAAVERRAKDNLKRYQRYHSIVSRLPDHGAILTLNCGQGEFPLMCALVKKNLSLTASESNSDLFAIAQNCISIPNNLCYEPTVTAIEHYTAFVLFSPTQQQWEAFTKTGKPTLCIIPKGSELKMTNGIRLERQKQYSLYCWNDPSFFVSDLSPVDLLLLQDEKE
jgi:1-acyl-sn-glycerol-3-phosphate acyltransferase